MTKLLMAAALAIEFAFVAASLAQVRPAECWYQNSFDSKPTPTDISACIKATKKLPLTPDVCGISGEDDQQHSAAEIKNIQRYCAELGRKLIAEDPGHYVIGQIEKADPIQDDPNAKYYYWLKNDTGDVRYFDSRSDIGKKILKVCNVGSTCALRVSIEKSWELNIDHATFWIAKVGQVTKMGGRK